MAIKKERLPIIPIRGFVIFPKTVFHFDVARPKSIAAVEKALISNGLIFHNHFSYRRITITENAIASPAYP